MTAKTVSGPVTTAMSRIVTPPAIVPTSDATPDVRLIVYRLDVGAAGAVSDA